MHEIFTYGTLMDPDIMTAVAGAGHRQSRATLHNFRRLKVKNADFPGIIPATGFSVQGILYSGISDADLRRLDAFEGEMYQRRKLEAELPSAKKTAVFAYVIKESFRHLLDDKDWDFEHFLRHKSEFI